jgi:hypothetical protein
MEVITLSFWNLLSLIYNVKECLMHIFHPNSLLRAEENTGLSGVFKGTDTWRYSSEHEAKVQDEAMKQIPTPTVQVILSPHFPPC